MKDKIVDLQKQGLSYRQIQVELGCSKGTISYYLGEGQKEKSRIRNRSKINAIRKYLQEYKQNKVCADCKENYPYWVLEFDHLSDKSFNISQFYQVTTSLEIVKKEVEKCEVVCANCHKDRTYLRKCKSGGDTLDIAEFYR